MMSSILRIKKQQNISPWLPTIFVDPACRDFNLSTITELSRKGRITLVSPQSITNEDLDLYARAGKLSHYILLNQSLKDYLSLRSTRVVHKINQGSKNLRFYEWTTSQELELYRGTINRLWIEQHMRHLSPCPPISLLADLLSAGLITIIVAFSEEEIVGFITVTNSQNIAHTNWVLINRRTAGNYASAALWYQAVRKSFEMGCNVLSMGTTSSSSLAIFKESIGGHRAVLNSALIHNQKIINLSTANTKSEFTSRIVARVLLRTLMKINKGLGVWWYSRLSTLIWKYASF